MKLPMVGKLYKVIDSMRCSSTTRGNYDVYLKIGNIVHVTRVERKYPKESTRSLEDIFELHLLTGESCIQVTYPFFASIGVERIIEKI